MVTFKVPPHLALSYLEVSDLFHPSLAAVVLGYNDCGLRYGAALPQYEPS
jgi:hypothetical protein